MQITYESRHGVHFASIPQLLGNEYGSWTNGQTRDVPDDVEVPAKIEIVDPRTGSSRSVRRNVKLTDAILMAGPDFRSTAIADPSGNFSGLHPDYVCAVCGRETLDLFFQTIAPNGTVTRHDYVDEHGARLCPRDYLLAHKDDTAAWDAHGTVEHSTGYDEAIEQLAQERADAPQETPAPASEPVPVSAPAASPAPVEPAVAPQPAPVERVVRDATSATPIGVVPAPADAAKE